MINFNLKKLIYKPEILSTIKKFIQELEPDITVWNTKGDILIGESTSMANFSHKYPIKVAFNSGSEIIGWVTGSEKALLVAETLGCLANQELEKKNLAIETLKKYEEIHFLYEVSSKVSNYLNIKEMIDFLINQSQKIIDCSNISVMLINEQTEELEIFSARGTESPEKTILRQGVGIAGHVLLSGQAEIVNDVQSDPRYLPGKQEIYSLLCTPLITANGTLGVINISNAKPIDYTAQDLKRFKALAAPVAAAIENARLYEQLKDYSQNLEKQVAERTDELEKANEKLHRLASIDALTQVANRRRFDEYLEETWNRLLNEMAPISLIMCDVDCFKSYNDTYGHQVGDRCLQQIAKAIGSAAKHPAYLVARYGGEEFAVILPNTSDRAGIYIAEMIKIEIEWLKLPHHRSTASKYVTMSLGVCSTLPSEETSPEQLIEGADRALYEAKKFGRDRIVFKSLSK